MSDNPTVRESIEAALDAGAAPDPAPSPEPLAAPAAPAAAPPASPLSGGGTPAPQSGAATPAPASSEVRPDAPGIVEDKKKPRDPFAPVEKFGEAKPKAPAAPEAPVAPELKAPASWKADLREKWKTLPPEVQGEVIRREKENDARLQEGAQLRRFAQKFSEITEPYRALMQAEGSDPMAGYQNYLKSAMLLRSGAPADKAAMLAKMIQHFGVPVALLDQYLEQQIRGGAVQQPQQLPQQQLQPQQFRDPRLDAMLEQQAQARAVATRNEAQAFAADPKNEFFEDVRLAMADVMDAAAKRGVVLSMQDAYERACQIEPEVRKVLQARAASGNASQAARTLAMARHAASSLPSASAPPAPRSNGAAKPGTVREAILASIDTLQSGA